LSGVPLERRKGNAREPGPSLSRTATDVAPLRTARSRGPGIQMRIISAYFRCTFRPRAAGYPAINARWPPRSDLCFRPRDTFRGPIVDMSAEQISLSNRNLIGGLENASGHVHCYDKSAEADVRLARCRERSSRYTGYRVPVSAGFLGPPPAAPVVLRERAVPRMI